MSELIDRLAADLKPTPAGAVAARLGLGLGAGAGVSVVLVGMGLGVRPDIGQAVLGAMFWIKLAYVAALGLIGLWCAERLARPAGVASRRLPLLLAPLLAIAALAAWQMTASAPPARMGLMMGHSARICPWLILAASLPPLAGLVWAVRGLAPTRLRLTGALIGLAAGGAGAAAYALHCDEAAAPFVAVWYSLGVAGAAALGAVLGPRSLRW